MFSPSLLFIDVPALLLAEKHETRPSTLKMGRFTEKLDVASASGWNKSTLTMFGFDFNLHTITPLKMVITDEKWYDGFSSEDCEYGVKSGVYASRNLRYHDD